MPKLCEYQDDQGFRCETEAIYGIESKKPLFCKAHKKDEMKYVKGTISCFCGKSINPIYGLKTDKIAGYCAKCKLENMIDIINKRCFCDKRIPCFGFLSDKKATRCNECKLENMIDIKNKKCFCGMKRPSFGLQSDKLPTRCSECKLEEMDYIKQKKCFCGKTISNFGYPTDKKATRCSECKLENMLDIIHQKCSCGMRRPSFGLSSDKILIGCAECKTEDMVNLKHKKCRSNDTHNNNCPIIGNKKYNGYCTHCFALLFPNHPKTTQIRSKSKELKVVNFISTNYEGFLHDKPLYTDLEGGCCASKRRIDLRKLIGDTMLCIEVDENEHKYYFKLNEEARYDDLYMDFSGKYILVRYNPDSYHVGNIKCNPQFSTRMIELKNTIDHHIKRIENGKNTELLEIHHLYYSS